MPKSSLLFRLGAASLLAGLVASAPGCFSTSPGTPLAMGQVVSGSVTYKGDKVPFGYVLFYNPQSGHDAKTGSLVPLGIGEIRDGRYEIPSAPEGPVII